jgi:hypothetical protein
MIKPILKTLSFSFVTLACAAILSASEQGATTERGAGSADSARVGCATQADIDLGWEEQLAQIEKLQAQRDAEGLAVPGAIITPPFEAFAPYRTDVPPAVIAAGATKAPRRHASGQGSRD